jgi:hypothetical protein
MNRTAPERGRETRSAADAVGMPVVRPDPEMAIQEVEVDLRGAPYG